MPTVNHSGNIKRAGLSLGAESVLSLKIAFRALGARADRTSISATFDRVGAGVTPVDFLLLECERMDHRMVARGASQNTFEDRPMFVDKLIPSATAIRFQLLLDRVEHRSIDDGLKSSLVDHVLVANQTGVQGIGQQRVDRAFVEGFSTTQEATFRLPLFV